MAAPYANQVKTSFFQDLYNLLSGCSGEFYMYAFTVFIGTVTSTGIGFPSFFATSI